MTRPFTTLPDNVCYFNRVKKSHAKREPFTKKCKMCGADFQTTSNSLRYCNDRCRNNAYGHQIGKPSRNNGSFLNETSFNKAWEESKSMDIWHNNNVVAQQIYKDSK